MKGFFQAGELPTESKMSRLCLCPNLGPVENALTSAHRYRSAGVRFLVLIQFFAEPPSVLPNAWDCTAMVQIMGWGPSRHTFGV